LIGSESKGECLSPEDIGLVTPERVGEIAAKTVVQLLFTTGKSFTVDGLREKLREFFRQEVRAELRAVAALNNVELITALISCNRQLGLVGLQLRILNGVVSLLTTRVENKALAAYVSEQSGASENLQMTTATLEVLACIAFRQLISQAEIDRLFDADKRGLVVKLRDLKLVEELPVPTAGCASPQLKHFYSASASQVCRN
jgi:chromosome segregation and condensation protein ScpB